MNDFLKRIKLIQTFPIDIPLQRIEFVKLCRKNIERKEDFFFRCWENTLQKGSISMWGL